MAASINIYQLFPRLFGNKTVMQHFDGDKSENGCGTFADIDDTALKALKEMGITHIWLTGILRHASSGETHPDITKGKAGSPYAVTDYYDVDPDLGNMTDFEQLVSRIHRHRMKVLIDFIPNHVARQCRGFSDENFYLLHGSAFVAPTGNGYQEIPAKASGNDVFSPNPSINDWYDTIKLNYEHRDTWQKMLSILQFWCRKRVDGFRVDMAEMVPLAFWNWCIAELRKTFQPLLIAEIYKPELYKPFLDAGFDYLYDKVGLYNTLEAILRHGQPAESISQVWKNLHDLDAHMLRFMENHDEVRLASPHFVGDAFAALPAVCVSALMNTGPFMIYNGQENSENAIGAEGYSGNDGRTSIFDYCSMPKHQLWMNGGLFNGGKCSLSQNKLRAFYSELLNLRIKSKAITEGAFYDLMWCNPWFKHFDPQNIYAFLRYHGEERLLIVVNFNRNEGRQIEMRVPEDAQKLMEMEKGNWKAKELFTQACIKFDPSQLAGSGLSMTLAPSQSCIWTLTRQKR